MMALREMAIERLKGRGMSITRPRILILEYLMSHLTHPSVDTIYSDLLEENPGLSKTTVYNTAQILTRKGVIRTLCIDETHVNLDGKVDPHAHLLCRCCGRIVDMPLTGITAENASIGFKVGGNLVEEVHQYFRGVCSDCSKKKKLTQ